MRYRPDSDDDRHRSESEGLLSEVVRGLAGRPQATLPAKLLYDVRGCELFDQICDLPEYYPTRTERALLERVAPDIARRADADELVELGSGMARKTHVLLGAMGASDRSLTYLPFDVSAVAIRESAEHLTSRFPGLAVHGVVGDFTRDLHLIPEGSSRIIAFLGGTIGNLDDTAARLFLGKIARVMDTGDSFLLAADLVKPQRLLHAAYNDSAGITAAFNLNALVRLKRELGAELTESDFSHDAFFNEAESRIEIHARARRATRIAIGARGFERAFEAGESVCTEISRKFTPASLARLLASAGLLTEELYLDPIGYALVLARRPDSARRQAPRCEWPSSPAT